MEKRLYKWREEYVMKIMTVRNFVFWSFQAVHSVLSAIWNIDQGGAESSGSRFVACARSYLHAGYKHTA